LNPEYYNEIIVGEKGLVPQRQFIIQYYPQSTHLINIDDDIERLDLTMTEYSSADDFFKKAFELCIAESSYIWGLYPVYNPFFREKRIPITTTLNFIIGAFYGIITRPNDEDLKLKITVGGNKEDAERTILYYLKDGKTVRFNKIGFKTKYYGTDGGGLGTFNDRLELMKTNSILLNQTYPEITKIKIRKNKMYEIVFKKVNPIQVEEPVYLPELDNPLDYMEVYELLCNSVIKNQTGKSGRARSFGKHRSIVLGYIKARITRKYNLSAETKKHPELYEAVVSLGKRICPFQFNAIQINHNVICSRHIDGCNVGKSVIVSLGDYEGCDLVVEGFGTYNTICRPLMFDGSKIYHYNTPLISGNKYSLVFYTNPN